MAIPVLTVAELRKQLATKPDHALVYAWLPGEYMPVAGVMFGAQHPTGSPVVLIEVNCTGETE